MRPLSALHAIISAALFCLTYGIPQSSAAPGATGQACVVDSSSGPQVTISAKQIFECIKAGSPVDLSGVRVVGDSNMASLDLGQLPVEQIPGSKGGTYPRLVQLIEEKHLAAVERQTGRTVAGVRVASERIRIYRSQIEIEIRGSDPHQDPNEPYAPVVFSKPVDLTDSHITRPVDFSYSLILHDFNVENVEMDGSIGTEPRVVLSHAHLFGEANFLCINTKWQAHKDLEPIYGPILLDHATFHGRLRFNCDHQIQIGRVDLRVLKFLAPQLASTTSDFKRTFSSNLSRQNLALPSHERLLTRERTLMALGSTKGYRLVTRGLVREQISATRSLVETDLLPSIMLR
jgi:hypothetical protein